MKRLLVLTLVTALALTLLAGCGSSTGDSAPVTVGEGVSTEGRPVFYEFFTQG